MDYQRPDLWLLAAILVLLPVLMIGAWSEIKNRPLAVALMIVALPSGVLLLRALIRTRKPKGKIKHEAWVSWVETDEPYFMAFCECDWFGDAKESEMEARAEAQKHTPNVRSDLERPLAEAE
jgi:hypothetical protein